MTKRIAILGSTGSVGRQALSLVSENRDRLEPVLLAAGSRKDLLFSQAAESGARFVALAERCGDTPTGVRVFTGADGLIDALAEAEPDAVLNAIVGAAGLRASHWTLAQGKALLLANKESLVAAGQLLTELAIERGGTILPIDSEHAAIHQCLRGERREDLRRVWLTASGGPFRDKSLAEIERATPEEALRHPTWSMGARITVGSATLMNKAFEVCEARHLFGLDEDEIRVVQHRESIVHSLCEFCDGSMIAQLGIPDMRVPILYCLGWPERLRFAFEPFDLSSFATLSFDEVDTERFPALELGYEALRRGGDSGAVLNAADEWATQAFLDRRIAFPEITRTVARVLEAHEPGPIDSLEAVLEADARARREAASCWR